MTTLCLSGAALHKAGANYNLSGAALVDEFITQAESIVNVSTHFDWVAIYAALPASKKYILESAVASLAAMDLVAYDLNSYGLKEAETMLDKLRDAYYRDIGILKDDVAKTFIIKT